MRTLPISLAACLLAAAGFAVTEGTEPPATPPPGERFTDWGRVTHSVPVASSEGDWDGTWFYVSLDRRMAIWIKTENGVPQVKLHYQSLASTEVFETDWDGNATYDVHEAKGKFSLGLKKREADVIEGHWDWELAVGKGTRVEWGDYRMYRTGDGRYMALSFDDLRHHVRGGQEKEYGGAVSFTFIKVAKRLALWDELPF